jgi:carboxyl-terminal processing protease
MLLEGRIENTAILASVRKQANDDVMELFLNAVAGALDPHSSYMSPSSMQSFETGMHKGFEGIGATLSSEDGYIVVKEVISGSPAEKAGIRPKDKIQGVGQGQDGRIEEVIDFKVTDVVKLIRGPGKTTVRLDILPGGKSPSKVVDIVRAKISLDDRAAKSEIFEAGMKPEGTPYKIGFIELPDFYFDTDAARQREANVRSAAADVKKMLNKFVEANVDAVVLDLRFNGGGALDMAIELTGLFTGAGTVVQVKDDVNVRPRQRGTNDPSCEWTGPLVVLTNKFSASASEIFSGAIKDYKRGLIVGDSTTHGKGSVQSLTPLSDPRDPLFARSTPYGAGKITIQGYYLPSGISPQRVGVEVDVVLPSLFDVMEDVMESDLDNALSFGPQPSAPNFSPKQYVSPQMIAELKRRSERRIRESEDFGRQMDRIVAYKESRSRRITPLNEEKYLEEVKRFNTDEWEQEELEDLISKDRKIKRDFYVEEVLALTVDYVNVTQEIGIAFPKERTIQRPARRGGLWGLGGW